MLTTEEFELNMGPQHPSTHGVLRMVLKMDGERVVSADDLDDEGQLLIRAGKKRYLRVITT